MAARKPSPELRAFGTEVTRLRHEAGLTQTELAKRVNVTRSYVGQVEAGTTRCRYDFAQRVDMALDTDTTLADAWDDLLRSTSYPRWFCDFPKAEATAAILRSYENRVVYGLLQTEAYARVLLVKDDAVADRMRRQTVLERTPPPTIYVVLEESILSREVGGREIMREQLERLLAVSAMNHVHLQIAPNRYHPGVRGGFSIATQPDGGEVAHLVNVIRGETSNTSEDLLHVTRAFATLQARALSVDDSRDLIERVLVERWR